MPNRRKFEIFKRWKVLLTTLTVGYVEILLTCLCIYFVGKSSLDWKWVVVVGALLSRIITTGTVICLGVFLEDVKSSFPQLTNINSKISTIFGTASGLLEGTGITN